MSAASSSELDKQPQGNGDDVEKGREATTSKPEDDGKVNGDEAAAATTTKTLAAAPPGAPGFFAWAGPALRNKRMLKTWVRCVLVMAAAVVLLVDHATLQTMGCVLIFLEWFRMVLMRIDCRLAGFFTMIVAVLLPPSLALSVFIMASMTILLGASSLFIPPLALGSRS